MVRSLLIAVPLALLAGAADASAVCNDRQAILDYLANEHGETPVASGTANNGGTVEVVASENGETWTILITMPDGRTCMMAAGNGWQNAPLVAAATAADPGA